MGGYSPSSSLSLVEILFEGHATSIHLKKSIKNGSYLLILGHRSCTGNVMRWYINKNYYVQFNWLPITQLMYHSVTIPMVLYFQQFRELQ